MSLTHDELLRYSRQILLPEVGLDGQQRLKAARVLCIGAGGLGSPAAIYMAAAGVGTIGLVDFDAVDVTNLQRQVLHGTPDVGRHKLESARDRLRALNPHVELELHDARLVAGNVMSLVSSYDVVLDGSDNFATRYMVNDACVLARRPNVYGSVFRFEGQASVFAVPGGPCYRCLHPEPPPAGLIPSCAEAGVLGVLPGVIGVIQATEAIKWILGAGDPLVGRFLVYDALTMRFRELRLAPDPDCPVCGVHPRITQIVEYSEQCPDSLARRPGAQDGTDVSVPDMTVFELKGRMDAGDPPVIVDVREPAEFEICRIPGARLIPLGQLPARAGELDPAAEVVLQCRSGSRSARATAFLRARGFQRARNLEGGILAWIDQVDHTQPKY